MNEHPGAIKQYRSPTDEQGGYRIYTVYQANDKFIFECWDCTEKHMQGAVGTRRVYDEYDDAAGATARFKEYIEAWEPDAKIDLS